jgi:hypothetical protein
MKSRAWYARFAARFGPANWPGVMLLEVPDRYFPFDEENDDKDSDADESMSRTSPGYQDSTLSECGNHEIRNSDYLAAPGSFVCCRY